MSLNTQHQNLIIQCDHCKTNPGPNPRNQALWFGFFDQDTKQYVCMACKPRHYVLKEFEKKMQGLYSEMPVTMQLMYKN